MANFAWFTKFHRFIYHHSGGWVGGNLGAPMVLMYTVGAKTGARRMVPLQYYPGGPEGILVLGSNNGQAKAPGWYFNLKTHPDIDIRVGREKRRVHAEELSPERSAEVWPVLVKQNPAVETYARNAGRRLPIMLLRTVKVY